MNFERTEWEQAVALRHGSWLMRAHVVEVRAARLAEIIRASAKFDPNQPRMPRGNPDGGQWTDGGGGESGSDSSDTLVGGGSGRRGRGSGSTRLGNGQFAEPTPGQAARYAVLRAEADARIAQVREVDPEWRPTPSFTETVEGEISRAQAEALEAEARLQELSRVGIGQGPFAGESIPARGPERDFTTSERREINRIGSETGCHTCGRKDPGTTSGNFILDHQPPSGLNSTSKPQSLLPHCLTCSLRQGGWVSRRGSRR